MDRAFTPQALTRKDASGQIAKQLRSAIADGVWGPGERLPTEMDLAETFDVSRNTAREALKLLSATGLLTSSRGGVGGGTYVAVPDSDEIAEVLGDAIRLWFRAGDVTVHDVDEARRVLEEFSVAMAAERHTDTDLDAIHGPVLAAHDFEMGIEDWLDLDLEFHTAITRAAHNPILELAMTSVHLIRPVTNRVFVDRLDRRTVMEQHEAMYQAIAGGDPDQARAAFATHIDYLDRVRQDVLRDLDTDDVRISDIR
ncbi:FadR/GntR family transcriptional regulator [Rhodococcus jostii]|uniref:DNA-binding transcriptional regulator, FadR family n=1 Tax=Rhodococcus jostii TaxID=132919 RepID=A0A1H4S8I7_RHOJO|nr:FadR/GntR family transcriptional regulator [Rhodococcus jostii]SEC40304.1 DNA-binding transcriptional regulator, FadR family [Rhodococcus jostii]